MLVQIEEAEMVKVDYVDSESPLPPLIRVGNSGVQTGCFWLGGSLALQKPGSAGVSRSQASLARVVG